MQDDFKIPNTMKLRGYMDNSKQLLIKRKNKYRITFNTKICITQSLMQVFQGNSRRYILTDLLLYHGLYGYGVIQNP